MNMILRTPLLAFVNFTRTKVTNSVKSLYNAFCNFLPSSRHRKYLALFAGLLLGGYLILCLAVAYLDPNQYKDKITAWVFEKTGETLVIDGNLHLSLFPSLFLEAEQVSLNPKQATQKSISSTSPHSSTASTLKAEKLRIYPKLWSLILNKPVSQIELFDLKWDEYKIRHLKTKYQYQEGASEFFVTTIYINTGKIEELLEIDYLKIDTISPLPKYTLKHKANRFPLHFFLTLLESGTQLTGDTSVSFDFTSEGINTEQIRDNLNGNFEIEVKQGKIHGLNVVASLKEAKSLLHSVTTKLTSHLTLAYNALVPRKEKDPGSTAYENLHIVGHIQNGIISKNLNVKHQHYNLKGNAKINLKKNSIDCVLEARYKEKGVIRDEHLSHSGLIPLKIYIQGNLQKPNIKTDFDSYIKFISQRSSAKRKFTASKTSQKK